MHIDGASPGAAAVRTIFKEAVFEFDTSWDAEWQAQVRLGSSGWTAEMAIPLSALGITSPKDMHWGINFRRLIAREAEVSEWAYVPTQQRNGGTVSRFGTLHLTQRIRPAVGRRVAVHLNGVGLLNDQGEEVSALPVPGSEGGLALTPGFAVQAAVSPEFLAEDFQEHLRNPLHPRADSVVYSRLFP